MTAYYIANIPRGFAGYNPEYGTRLSCNVTYNPRHANIVESLRDGTYRSLDSLPIQIGTIFQFVQRSIEALSSAPTKTPNPKLPLSGIGGDLFFHDRRIGQVYTNLPDNMTPGDIDALETPFSLDAPGDLRDRLKYQEVAQLPPLVLVTSQRIRPGEPRTLTVDYWSNPRLKRTKLRPLHYLPVMEFGGSSGKYTPEDHISEGTIGKYDGDSRSLTAVFGIKPSEHVGLTQEGEQLRDQFIESIQRDQKNAIPRALQEDPRDLVFERLLADETENIRVQVYGEDTRRRRTYSGTTLMDKIQVWKYYLRHEAKLAKERGDWEEYYEIRDKHWSPKRDRLLETE